MSKRRRAVSLLRDGGEIVATGATIGGALRTEVVEDVLEVVNTMVWALAEETWPVQRVVHSATLNAVGTVVHERH